MTSNEIHTEVAGAGAPLVLLHGWGLHGGIWESTAAALAREFQVIRVDLPGFGRSKPLQEPYTAASLAQAVASVIAEPAVWIGWSLGGMVALAAAISGAAVKELVLVDSTPRFVQGADWPYAIAPEVLASFASELESDYKATVMRFLALQARGSERARDELRNLRETVFAHGEPTLSGLRGGLDVLRESDLRPALASLRQRTLIIQGERDVLVPVAAAEATVAAMPDARLTVIPGAGHAPFISHPDEFIGTLLSFLHE